MQSAERRSITGHRAGVSIRGTSKSLVRRSAVTELVESPRVRRSKIGPSGWKRLEPYYDKVEYEIGVSGKAGNINGKIDPAGNVHEGPRQRDYPMPPLRGSDFSELMADAARKLRWKPFRPPA